MNLLKLENKNKISFKYILLPILAFCTIFSDVLIKQNNIGVQLTLSSIFMFLIIGLFKSNASLLTITILNCVLIFINGFNILIFIEVLEIYYVWVLYRRNKKNIVIEVLIFWVGLALPVIFITSYIVSNKLNIESAFFIILISMNRIFNALIGNMLLDYIPFRRIVDRAYYPTKKRTLSNTLFHACTASIVVPIIIFSLATNSSNTDQISEIAIRDLKSASEYVSGKVSLWTDEEKNNLKMKNVLQIHNLVEMLKMYVSTSGNYVNYYLIDLNDTVIVNDNTVDYMKSGLEWLKEGSLTEIHSNTYKWTAPRENAFLIKNYSTKDAYIYITTVDNLKIAITVSEDVYANKSIDVYLDILKILIPLSLAVGVFVIVLKRFILNSISKLIEITSDLPEKLKSKEKVMFEKTNISELDILTDNFQIMVNNLSNMILNVEATNKKLQESERMLYDQAHYDSLTGLPNRHYFFKNVEEIMGNFQINEVYSNKEGIAFFFMDLDKFKSVNDNFGHSAGDKLLKEVANRMNNVLKVYESSCTFIARLGGDEFVIAFIYDDKDEISKLAKDLIEAINKPISIEDNEFIPETSIGICLYPEDGEDLESIFIKSDTSMYKAKYAGGNTFLFYSSLN